MFRIWQWVLMILWRHFIVYKIVDHKKIAVHLLNGNRTKLGPIRSKIVLLDEQNRATA